MQVFFHKLKILQVHLSKWKQIFYFCSDNLINGTFVKNIIMKFNHFRFSTLHFLFTIVFGIVLGVTAGCNHARYHDERQTQNTFLTDTVFTSPIDSMEWLVNNTHISLRGRIKTCDKLAFDFVYVDVNKAISYAQMGLNWAETMKKDSLTGSFYRILGMSHQIKNNYDSAKFYYEKSLTIAIQCPDENLESFLYLAYGLLYSELSDYEQSAQYYEKALRLCEKNGYKIRYNSIILNIAITCLKMQNYERAEQYFLKAKENFAGDSSPERLAHVYLNMGIMYREQDKLDQARVMSDECLKLFQSIGNTSGEALALMNQSRLFAIEKKYAQALEVAHKSLALAEKSGFVYVIKNAFSELSLLYSDMGNYRLSEEYALKVLGCIDSKSVAEIWITYKKLIPIYVQLGKKTDAIRTFFKYDSLSNVVNSAQVQNTYNEMQTKYETEKKEIKISALEEEKRLLIWLSIAGGAVLLFSLATFLFLWRWTVQKRQLAETRVKQLEQEKQLVITQALLDGETAERTRIARDLHDGLGSILAGTKLNLLEMKKGVSMDNTGLERYDTALILIDQSLSEMRRVAHHLMPEALISRGLKQSIADFCNSIPSAVFNYFGEETPLDPKLELMMYRIMHELVSNALKHSGATHILVEIVRYDNTITLTIQDNGCGFDLSAVSQGMGLANIRNRVDAYNGNLLIDTKTGVGTEVNVELKIEKI